MSGPVRRCCLELAEPGVVAVHDLALDDAAVAHRPGTSGRRWPAGAGQALGIVVSVLIITCPCALSLATPAATLAAAGALARRGILVRRLDALESGASIDTVIFDKTGTLTHDRMGVAAIRTRPGADAGEVLQQAAALARHSLHPASRALVAAAGPARCEAEAVLETAGQGLRGRVVGTGGAALDLRLGSADFCGAPQAGQTAAAVHLADERGWLASFDLDETIREDAAVAVARLGGQGLHVQLLSGDRSTAVTRLADRAGIRHSLGGQSPEDKLEHLRACQAQGHRVAMVGDGLNDGPVLARADLSVALGRAVPLAQSRSDFVVLGGQVQAIPAILALARRTRRIVRQNLAWAAAYNAVCVPLALAGWMPPWLAGLGMAASSLFVVANAARLSRLPGSCHAGLEEPAPDFDPGASSSGALKTAATGLRVKPAMTSPNP